MIQPVRPSFESRTEFDLIEVVRWLSDPSILPIERLRDISGFVGNILSEFEASFPTQDRRRLRWDRCCVELRQLGANIYQSALRGEACNKVLHRTLGGFEQVEGRMRRLIYQLDDKDQQARWGEEMAVVFRFLCFAIAALWRTDRVADRFS